MYGMQFMCHTRGRQGQKYSSLQFWRGRIKIVFLLICGPLEDVKQDIENRTFALPEMEKKKSREREYIEWSNVNVSTVNGDINYDEYFRLAD